MTTDFSPPYRVQKTTAGFVVMNSVGGHEALFGNRGEAEEISDMMNEQVEMNHLNSRVANTVRFPAREES